MPANADDTDDCTSNVLQSVLLQLGLALFFRSQIFQLLLRQRLLQLSQLNGHEKLGCRLENAAHTCTCVLHMYRSLIQIPLLTPLLFLLLGLHHCSFLTPDNSSLFFYVHQGELFFCQRLFGVWLGYLLERSQRPMRCDGGIWSRT